MSVFALTILVVPSAIALPAGFEETTLIPSISGNPTAVRFAADGKVFIALKYGVIQQLDSVADTTPSTFVDFSSEVLDISDQGLLGLAVHPQWPAKPYIYGLYTVQNNDTAGGRLTRWTYNFTTGLPVAGSRLVILNDGWCFALADSPWASHSIGDLQFGADGALYASAGEGANYDTTDVGDFAVDKCSDPAGEGGALRSQDLQTSSDPASYNGALILILA